VTVRFVLAASLVMPGVLRLGQPGDPAPVAFASTMQTGVTTQAPSPVRSQVQDTAPGPEPEPGPSSVESPAPSAAPSEPPSPAPEPGTSQSVVVGPGSIASFPFVLLRPDTGSPGDVVEIEGAGWDPTNRVSIFFASGDADPTFQVTANGEGRFKLCAPVPARPPASYALKVCQHCGASDEVSTDATFVVTAQDAPRSPGSPGEAAVSLSCRAVETPSPSPREPSVLPIVVLPPSGPRPSPTALPPRLSPRPPQPSPPPQLSPMGQQVEAAVNQEVDQIQRGFIAFNPSRQMRMSVPERVEANILRAFSDELTGAVQDVLSQGLTGPGRPEFAELDVGEAMTVRLEGRGAFEVHAITPENQALVEDRVTSWKWDVTPKSAGTHSLILCVDIQILVPQRNPLPISNCSFERLIHVRVNPVASSRSFFTGNWQWVIGGPVGTALFAWIARARQRRRRRTKPKAGPRRPSRPRNPPSSRRARRPERPRPSTRA
jgi:hypothetical protein